MTTPISSTPTLPIPDIRFRVVVWDTPSIPGGGVTTVEGAVAVTEMCDPYAAMLNFSSGQNADSLGAESVHARMSMGYFHTTLGVGTLDGCIGTVSENGVSPTYCVVDDRLYGQGNIVIFSHIHSVPSETIITEPALNGDFKPFGTVIGDPGDTNHYRCFSVAINGYNAQHAEARPQLGHGTSPITIDCTGLLVGTSNGTWTHTTDGVPHCVICISANNNGFSTARETMQVGVAHRDGTQYSFVQVESNGNAAGRPAQVIHNDCIAAQLDPATGTVDYKVSVSNWTSTSFDITPSADAGDDRLHLFVLGFDNQNRCKVMTFSTPTVTGNVSYTGVGFKPQFGFFIGSSMEAFNTVKFDDPLAGGLQLSAVSIVDGNITQQAQSIRIKQGANPTDTASRSVSKTLSIPSDSASDVVVATLVSMDADGFTLNYSAVAASAKKVVALLVEEAELACNVNGTIYWEKQNPDGDLLGNSTFKLHSDTLGNFTIADNGSYDGNATSGKFLISEVPPGNYTLTETVAPTHYILDSTPITIVMGELDNIVLDPIVDQPKPSTILIEKRDVVGNLIPGATYLVEKEGGGNVTVLDDSDDDLDPMPGRTVVGNLSPGNYTVTETVPPDGYLLDETVHIVTLGPDDDQSVGIAGEADEDDVLDNPVLIYVPHVYTLCHLALASEIELGPFRYTEQKQADETSLISSLILGLSEAIISTIELIDFETDDGDEDFESEVDVLGDDIFEDWGFGFGFENNFRLELLNTEDGMNNELPGPEVLLPITDNGSTKQYSPMGYSAIFHRLKLKTVEVDDNFYVKFVNMAGLMTGRQV